MQLGWYESSSILRTHNCGVSCENHSICAFCLMRMQWCTLWSGRGENCSNCAERIKSHLTIFTGRQAFVQPCSLLSAPFIEFFHKIWGMNKYQFSWMWKKFRHPRVKFAGVTYFPRLPAMVVHFTQWNCRYVSARIPCTWRRMCARVLLCNLS